MKISKLIFLSIGLSILFQTSLISQFPNGISLNTEEALDGYTLLQNFEDTYLINNCGEIVKTWAGYNMAEYHPKLTKDGNLVFIAENGVSVVTWNGFSRNVAHGDPSLHLLYEVIILPNGNYLCVGRRDFSAIQFNAIGYNIPGTNPWEVDVVVELDKDSGEILWEWNIAEHVIQQRDPSANNYGILSDHPELLNLDAISTYDWNFEESFMINGMDYNADLDLIVLSVRKLSEIIIIDHSTSKIEVKGHTGGNHGKGGDILYRWGNPQNYGMGTEDDRKLYFQHNPHWIKEGPHEGKIMIFNNGLNRPGVGYGEGYSSVPIFSLPIDFDGKFIIEDNQAFGPSEPDIQYDGNNDSGRFFSGYTSGASFLPNGNLFVTEGARNRLIELNPEGETVWQYVLFRGGYLFRAEKYPANYPGFAGRILVPNGTVENPPSPYICETLTGTDDLHVLENVSIQVYKNPGTSPEISVKNKVKQNLECIVYDISANKVMHVESRNFDINIDFSNLAVSNYILIVKNKDTQRKKAIKIIKL